MSKKDEVKTTKEVKDTTLVVPVVEPTEAVAIDTEKPRKDDAEEAGDSPSQLTAKKGKRSAKAIKEAEEKEAKASRKAAQSSEAEGEGGKSAKAPAKPARSRLERRSKTYRKSAELIEKGKAYSLKQAIELAVKTSGVKFDATVELHINLNVDPRQADQNIRDNLVLPAGTGKKVRIAVFADENTEGADIAGTEKITKQLEKGLLDFDILISTPANMPKLGKYARSLGPRGLMPNPKSGTVTTDVAKAIKEAKAGRVEYRVDSTGIVHLGVGKVSFGAKKLEDNISTVLASIKGNKPGSVKGAFVKTIYLTTTMGPSIPLALSEL